jgi:hypothetical protein
LKGASAAGLGATGEIKLERRGTGMLRLADGGRVKFDVTQSAAAEGVPLRGGQIQLIVLAGEEVKGVGKSRRTEGRSASGFFIRSV